jgi:hypothetical protein
VINLAKGKDYYQQRNNELRPGASCNSTSMVQALSIMGLAFPKSEYKQPEDALTAYIIAQGGNPEIHADLSRFTNQWMSKDVTKFSTALPVDSILLEIKNGRPVVLSGTFPGHPTPMKSHYGHIVTLVGYEESKKGIIIDDPYGNTIDNWKGSGREVFLSWEQFVSWFKPCGNASVKWGHTFKAA